MELWGLGLAPVVYYGIMGFRAFRAQGLTHINKKQPGVDTLSEVSTMDSE